MECDRGRKLTTPKMDDFIEKMKELAKNAGYDIGAIEGMKGPRAMGGMIELVNKKREDMKVAKSLPAKKEWKEDMKTMRALSKTIAESMGKVQEMTQEIEARRNKFWAEVTLHFIGKQDTANMSYNDKTEEIEILEPKGKSKENLIKSPIQIERNN